MYLFTPSYMLTLFVGVFLSGAACLGRCPRDPMCFYEVNMMYWKTPTDTSLVQNVRMLADMFVAKCEIHICIFSATDKNVI